MALWGWMTASFLGGLLIGAVGVLVVGYFKKKGKI